MLENAIEHRWMKNVIGAGSMLVRFDWFHCGTLKELEVWSDKKIKVSEFLGPGLYLTDELTILITRGQEDSFFDPWNWHSNENIFVLHAWVAPLEQTILAQVGDIPIRMDRRTQE